VQTSTKTIRPNYQNDLRMVKEELTMPNNNQPAVPGTENALDRFKYEIASEFGVTLGGDRTSRENGRVGGEMTKRMIQLAERQLQGGGRI
jgi:hypothetical protein